MREPQALRNLRAAIIALESRDDLISFVDELCELRGRLDMLAHKVSEQAAACRAPQPEPSGKPSK